MKYQKALVSFFMILTSCVHKNTNGDNNTMNSIMRDHQVPGFAVLKVEGKNKSYTFSGLRELGTNHKIEATDQWHIGSCSKSMSAYLIGTLVDQNLIHFEDNLLKFFPQLKDNNFKNVTITDLLSHTSGIPEVTDLKDQNILNSSPSSSKEKTNVRNKLVEEILQMKPKYKPTAKFEYSNSNYVILGQIVEQVTGAPWEESLSKNIFGLLGMKGCGFGPSNHISGHTLLNGQVTAVPIGGIKDIPSDNPTSIAAAGSVHCSMESWETFLREMLNASKGKSQILQSKTASFLFSPYKDGVSHGGWGANQKHWGNGIVYTMVGSNELNYAMYAIAPERDLIFAGAVNTGTDDGLKGLTEVLKALVK